MKTMTIKERIEAVLRNEQPDQVPFTIYPMMFPRGGDERELRNKGLGLAWRTDVIRWDYPNCKIEKISYYENAKLYQRETWSTPVGEVYSIATVNEATGNSDWPVNHFLKSRNDYKVLEFIANDACPLPSYDQFEHLSQQVGDDGYVIGQLGYSPLMQMIIIFIGMAQYAFEMVDNPDEFWSLYEALDRKMQRAYPIAADSPAHLILYGGNVFPQLAGVAIFEERIMPCYNEFAVYLHKNNKLLGVHFDANTMGFQDSIAASNIDVIEAFTPPPDCDMTLEHARMVWPDKIIWANFPSSVHLRSPDEVRKMTLKLLAEAAPGNRFIMGITEDLPAKQELLSLKIIADTINEQNIASTGVEKKTK